MKLNLSQKIDIVFPDGTTDTLPLSQTLGKNKTILYFYPRDNTPGCTTENKDFSSLLDEFLALGYSLVGVSKDSVESHQKFITKHSLRIPLISDESLALHNELGAFGEKKNYGKIVQGVIRSTFIFDSEGNMLQDFRNIRAKGHAERILKLLQK